jgi:dihydropteroate synthase
MLPSNCTPEWAGLSLDRPRIMGILNVTPDSFSGAGPQDSVKAGMAMADAGADIIDIGGESTRPGAAAVPPDVEQGRVIPVVRALSGAGLCVSVDTRNAATMRAALDAGAKIINDVSGLTHDPDAAALIASSGCPVVLMHMRGTPDTMNAAACYGDVVAEVLAELTARVGAALAAGIAHHSIAIDPGIGFAKLVDHSRAILRDLAAFTSLGYPVLVGVSRKSFIGAITGETRADRRLGGSLAAAVFAALRGAKILRVHDVPETVQAFRVWHSLLDSRKNSTPLA